MSRTKKAAQPKDKKKPRKDKKPVEAKVKKPKAEKKKVAKSGRATCRKANLDPFKDEHTIKKGSVRLGSETFMARMKNYAFLYTELCCVTPTAVRLVLRQHGTVGEIPGFDQLSEEHQLGEVREIFDFPAEDNEEERAASKLSIA